MPADPPPTTTMSWTVAFVDGVDDEDEDSTVADRILWRLTEIKDGVNAVSWCSESKHAMQVIRNLRPTPPGVGVGLRGNIIVFAPVCLRRMFIIFCSVKNNTIGLEEQNPIPVSGVVLTKSNQAPLA
mmetsp:Transcript_16739/g.30368  ORF Transcript_16739/g.30368 Transcript_16739/m.30368 type:complete len:127 (+) Transcript_16739:730-1110(+)